VVRTGARHGAINERQKAEEFSDLTLS
jgi:hypothetical protein